jgi:hypothetical protein
MAHLQITTIGPGELEALDALNDHLQAGKGMSTFVFTPESQVEIVPVSSNQGLIAPSDVIPESLDFEQLERIYTFLQRAADNEWHLPTSVVRSITGATPKGRYWKRYGFEFVPATRHGVEKAWAVSQASWDFPLGGGPAFRAQN